MTVAETAAPPVAPVDPAMIAERVGTELMGRDKVGQSLGIDLLDIGPGHARMAMTVREDMINGHAICHGAYLFALADTACAYAGNSRNVNTLSQGAALSFIAPAKLGDRLTAEATETAAGGRSSYVDVVIRNDGGETLAILRGQLRAVRGQVTD